MTIQKRAVQGRAAGAKGRRTKAILRRLLVLQTVCVLLAALLPICSTASANSWGLNTVMLDAVSATHDWDDYTSLSDQAEVQFTDVDGLPVAVAVLHSRYHNVLLTSATAEDDRTQFVRYAVTTAVWQPEDDAHTFDALLPLDDGSAGFTLCCDGTERYRFALSSDTYRLVSAQVGETSFFWSEDQACYQVLGEDVLSGASWVPPDGQITLTDFNISLFPRSVDEVAGLNTLTDQIGARLVAQDSVIDRQAEGTLAVYSAPSESAWCAAGGKASVSLKETVWILGVTENAEGVWTCIEYNVSSRTARIGYVKANLTSGCDVCAFTGLLLNTAEDTGLTDDPDVSQYPQKEIPAGTELNVLAVYNAYYAYVESEIDGQTFRGFVPLRALQAGAEVIRSDVMAQIAGEWLLDAGGNMGLEGRVLEADGTLLQRGDPDTVELEDIYQRCEAPETGENGSPLYYRWTVDIDTDPVLGVKTAIGSWYVTEYNNAARRYWHDADYELVMKANGKTVRLGLEVESADALNLFYWEGGGGYVRVLPME